MKVTCYIYRKNSYEPQFRQYNSVEDALAICNSITRGGAIYSVQVCRLNDECTYEQPIFAAENVTDRKACAAAVKKTLTALSFAA